MNNLVIPLSLCLAGCGGSGTGVSLVPKVQAATESTTYVYSDQQFTNNFFGQSPAFSGVTLSLVLASPLPANGTSILTPSAFSVSTPLGLLSPGFTEPSNDSFYFLHSLFIITTTNSTITAWDIEISALSNTTDSSSQETLILTNTKDYYAGSTTTSIPECNQDYSRCFTIAAEGQAGAWQ